MILHRALSELLAEGTRNGLTKPKRIRGTGVKMIGMGEIFANSRIGNIEMERVPVTNKELENYCVQPNDLLFARQSLKLEGAGKCSIIVAVNEPTVFESHLIRVRIDESVANPVFVYYFFNSPFGHKYIMTIVEQVAAAGLRASDLVKLKVPCPNIEIQNKSAYLLKMIDDKIALNQQINKNLEEQAQAIYMDMLCENDCKAVELQELCTFQEGYVNPPQGNTEYFDGEVKWLRAVDINESYIINTSRTLTKEGFDSAKKSALLFEPDTIAISKSGTIGRLGIIGDYMCGNRAVINIKPQQKEMLPFIYLYLKSRQREFAELAVGSVQKNLYVSLLEPLIVMIPKKDVLQSFCENADRQFEMIKRNCLENERLSQIRDALLPRLMSGEIDVSGIAI